MTLLWILIGIAAVLIFGTLLASFICYRIAFYVPPRKEKNSDEIEIPEGKIYEPFRDSMVKWTKALRAMPYEEFSVQSFDGLTLYGKY